MAARRLPTVYGRRRGDDAGPTRLIHPGVRSIDTYKDPLLCCRISCDVSPPTSGFPHCPFLASPPHNTLLSPPSSCIIRPERERDALARPDAPIYHLCSLPGAASSHHARQQAMGQARRPSHKVLALLRATPTSLPAPTRQRLSYGKYYFFFARCRSPLPFILYFCADRESHLFSLIDCDSREKTVDYRFTNPPRAPSRSSFALVCTYCYR